MTNIIAMEAVSVHGLSLKAKYVFLYLAKRSNKADTCFPSKSTIAKDCEISLSSVTRALAELVLEGLIEKAARYRKDNGCTSNLYTLRAEASPNTSEDTVSGSIDYDTPPCQNDIPAHVNVIPQELVKLLTYEADVHIAREDDEKSTVNTDNSPGGLREIFERCDVDGFMPAYKNPAYAGLVYAPRDPAEIGDVVDYSVIFRQAITQMYFADSLRVGGVTLPREIIRDSLAQMDYNTLERVRDRLDEIHWNRKRSRSAKIIRNTSAYVRSMLFNAVGEVYADRALAG
jgi:predicted transcriptional regulator